MSRVYLRELRAGDAHALAAVLSRNRSFQRPFDPERPEEHFTAEGQLAQIEQAVLDRDADRGYVFGVFEQRTDELVGRIALTSVVRGAWQNAHLGYWVDHARGGRGYATEAVGAMVAHAFDALQLHRVQAAIMPANVASVRVVEKNGFRLEGIAVRYLFINGRWEDHGIHALTREERGP